MWKLLLSRLGLFKELFSDLRGEKKDTGTRERRRTAKHVTPHTVPRTVLHTYTTEGTTCSTRQRKVLETDSVG